MTPDPAGLLPTPPKKPNELIDRTNRILKITPGKATAPDRRQPHDDRDADGHPLPTRHVRCDRFPGGCPRRALPHRPHAHDAGPRRPVRTAAGIIFGRCSDCGVKGPSLSLEEILRDRFGPLPAPAISGLSFGHIEQKLVLPIGARATLGTETGTLPV